MSLSLSTHGDISSALWSELQPLVANHTDLKTVLDAWHGATPPRSVVEVVTQDEYTHDVVIAYAPNVYLVYDAT